MSKAKKIALISTINIFCLLITFILFLPIFYSSNYGRIFFEKKITKKLKVYSTIEHLSLSWFGPQIAGDIQIRDNDLSIEIKKLSIDIPFWSIFKLEDITKKTIFALDTTFKIEDGTIYLPKTSAKLSDFQAELKIDKNKAILTANGKTSDTERKGSFTLNGNKDKNLHTTSIDLKSVNIPTYVLDSVFSLRHPKKKAFFSKFLGRHVDLNYSTSQRHKMGPIEITVDSTNCYSKMYFQKEKDGLHLNRDLKATVHISDDVSTLILQNINPLFLTGISSIEPCEIFISKKGFLCPLPFNKDKLKIDYGYIDMKRIAAQMGNTLSFLITILKLPQFHTGDDVSMWFTPVNLRVENGLVTTDRMDVLIDHNIHVCTWGQVNLMNTKVNMILGLTADALKNAFHITNLPDDFVLQIPMKGKTNKLKLDAKKAAAQIALLMAGSTTKGWMGDVLGTFGQIHEKKAPPPKRPFPWEKKGIYKPTPDQNPLDDFFEFFN